MIIYFSDRQLNILGHASTSLPDGPIITDDLKIEDVETGVASFECRIPFDKDTREQVNAWAAVGNYILRSHESENEFYTIIDFEEDTDSQEVYIYAEDAGLDLLNEVVGPYEADKAYDITHYINKFAYDSGFIIGTNEVASLTRKLSWDGEATAAERIASIATQFDGCEVSYSFDVKGLEVTNKYINIHKERGKDIGAQLRLNKEIDRIITKKSIANLATGLEVTGGTPETEGEEEAQPITLSGYKYDDGNFYVKGTRLLSREALKKWSRYNWTKEPNQLTGEEGHIIQLYSYDTTSQKELCSRAVTELKKLCEIEVNYEVDIKEFPENINVGDRINIIDDAGELYVSARVLRLDTSVVNHEQKATIGEYLIKGSGISQKVADLSAKFAVVAAENAKARAEAARKAAQAAAEAEAARLAAEEAAAKAAQAEADLKAAQAAAEEAQRLSAEAQAKAAEAEQAAINAKAESANASAAVQVAQNAAQLASDKATEATTTAQNALQDAADAKTTAEAAKLDAKKATEDIVGLGENLESLSNTMSAEYARKTDLTEAQASLQTQIEQNAAEISTTASRVQTIDETANNAATQAQAAQTIASAAQTQAAQATSDAQNAVTAANNASTAAQNAQAQADAANEAAQAAQKSASDADAKAAQAQTDLNTAKANLQAVTSRVDATEAEVEAAQAAVQTAQAAADKAKADAVAAQSTADTAKDNASMAQTAATNAKKAADEAQAAADEAQAVADAAQSAVNALAVRVTTAETKIVQNSEQIALMATKKEVAQTLGGYYTKEETEAAIEVSAGEISLSVDNRFEGLQIGARNLIRNSESMIFENYYFYSKSERKLTVSHDGAGHVSLTGKTLLCEHDGNGNVFMTY